MYDLDLNENLMNINGGDAQIHRAIINLLANAHDAMQDVGRITIRTENFYADDTSVAYGQVPKGEYVKLTITDTGCGITDEVKEKILDPFFSTKAADRKRGSGLGMSVVDAVVKDHNGYLDLKSKVGTGTSFFIYFPICREKIEEAPSSDVKGGLETILIVDDDEMQQEVSSIILKKLGYNVVVVDSGERAIEYLRENSVDLLVLDMIMPGGIDGTETFRQAKEINSDQRAIIVSGFSETDRALEAQNLGVGSFIKKPLTKEIIARAVRTELDKQHISS